MLIGISVRLEVFNTRNMIIGLLAVSFRGFSSCRPSMAFRPSGVAALSSPSMLAARFMKMLPVTGCPLGMSGKSLLNSGPNIREKRLMTPPCSPIFMIPNQSDKIPVNPNEMSKAVFDESKVELMIAGKTSKSPQNIKRTRATMNAMTKKAIQM